MKLEVVFSPEAQEQLAELYRYIAEAASPAVAAQYTEASLQHEVNPSSLDAVWDNDEDARDDKL